MTAPSKQGPVIRFTHGTGTGAYSHRREWWAWSCTCKQRLDRLSTEAAAMQTAQAHSDWHWDRGQHSTLELGGLR